VLLATMAVLVPLACGLLGLGASAWALAAATLAVAAAAGFAAGPAAPPRYAGASPSLAACAAAGMGVAFALRSLFDATVRTDGFHLAEVVRWLHEGHPGTVELVRHEWPAGAYPLANELILTWGAGIARSFAPVALWTAAATALLAGATFHGLRERRVDARVAALAAAAVTLLTAALARLEGAGTDLPAVAWLACALALVAHPDSRHRLPGPALLAAALAIGTKTNMAALAVVALAAALWGTGWRPRRFELVALGAGAVVALAWPARNLLLHGSPLWPFSGLGPGDPVPYVLSEMQTSFAADPGAVLEQYAERPADALRTALPLAGALLLGAVAGLRDARFAAGLTLFGVVTWAVSPLSGILYSGDDEILLIWYVLPAVLMACAALALAARGSPIARMGAPAVLALSALACLPELGRDTAFPSHAAAAVTLAGGAAAGALAGLGMRPPRIRGWSAGALAVVALAAATAWSAPRYGDDDGTPAGPLLAWLAEREGDAPVLANWAPDGRYAGPELERRVGLLPLGMSCEQARATAREAWVVIVRRERVPAYSRIGPDERCFAGVRPAFDDAAFLVFGPA
jgi:hypothetical protein